MLSHTQNYINNKKLISDLLSFVDFKQSYLIVEIGPGKGIITEQLLLRSSNKIIAIEADPKLYFSLKNKFKEYGNNRLKIILGDILKFNFPREPFIAVSNIPFNITADIVRKLTRERSALQEAYLIVQKEAAMKFIGPPRAHSPLFSHLLHIKYEVSLLLNISKNNYSPRPKFDTAFISIKKRKNKIFNETQVDQFKDFLAFLFEKSKGNIKNTLKLIMSNIQVKIILDNSGIDKNKNIKLIYFDEWVNIFNNFLKYHNKDAFKKISGSYQKMLSRQKKLKKIHRTRND